MGLSFLCSGANVQEGEHVHQHDGAARRLPVVSDLQEGWKLECFLLC